MAKHRTRRRHHQPSAARKADLIRQQFGKCYYCSIALREFTLIKGELVFSGLHWDHVTPWSYSLSNHDNNFVASCQLCNQIKSDKVFESIHEARYYVRTERTKRGLPVFELPKPIHLKTKVAKVLQSQVSDSALLEAPSNRKPRIHRTAQSEWKRIGIVNGQYVSMPNLPPPSA